ncbi:hypothetical protein BpHYR1_015105 [Brachionus plicatilis]|uniref:Uncharacterized protein n=1 Tax=Brachionus plicatilis TaxID=10195 RepID=A0A3M7Q5M1_BRAPC|nr:hypothetical protein BpHYR1_015105 [Brachionus plicatilis]
MIVILTWIAVPDSYCSGLLNKTQKSAKRQKLDDSSEIQFLKGRSYTYSERVPISLQLLKLEKNQELTNFHITEFQNLIYKKYNVQGLFMPDYYTLKNAPFNPEIIHESIFIHVLHAENHWIVLANLHPTYEDPGSFNNWFIDSLNNHKHHLNLIKTISWVALDFLTLSMSMLRNKKSKLFFVYKKHFDKALDVLRRQSLSQNMAKRKTCHMHRRTFFLTRKNQKGSRRLYSIWFRECNMVQHSKLHLLSKSANDVQNLCKMHYARTY